MILSLFVSGIETTLMTIETTNAIAMRLGMIANGETEPLRETELTRVPISRYRNALAGQLMPSPIARHLGPRSISGLRLDHRQARVSQRSLF